MKQKDIANLKNIIKNVKKTIFNDYIKEYTSLKFIDYTKKVYDAYHPTGTTILGSSNEFEIDLNLKNKKFKNLYVLSTSNFPGPGKSNPTLALLCFAHQLCDNLSKKINI